MLIQRYVDGNFDIEATENEIQIHACLSSVGTDLYGDRIKEGAFDAFLDDPPASLPMMYQHDSADTIGVWRSFELDGKRLMADGVIYRDIGRANDAVKLLDRGAIKGVSIGFRIDPDKVEFDFEKGGFVFDEVTPIEASIVSIPANPDGQVLALKKQLNAHNKEPDMTKKHGDALNLEQELEDTKLELSRLRSTVEKMSADRTDPKRQDKLPNPETLKQFKELIDKGGGNIGTLAMFEYAKRDYTGNVAVPGSQTLGMEPIYQLPSNQIVNDVTTVLTSVDSQSGTRYATQKDVPTLATVTPAVEATVNESRTIQGGISDESISLARYFAEVGYSDVSFDTVPYLSNVAISQLVDSFKTAFEGLITTTLIAKVKAIDAAKKVKTGVGTGLPTAANVMGVMGDLMGVLDTPYEEAGVFYVSTALWLLLHKATAGNAEFAYDPTRRINLLYGHPLKRLSGLDDGKTANDVSAVFMAPMRAVILALSDNVNTRTYIKTAGMTNIFSGVSAGCLAGWDSHAITGLYSAA